MDCFIFVGTNFRGLNKNHTIVGLKIRGYSIFLHIVHTENCYSWALKFVGRTIHENHENWYPTKIKPSTVLEFTLYSAVHYHQLNDGMVVYSMAAYTRVFFSHTYCATCK